MSDRELIGALGRAVDDGHELRPPPDRVEALRAEVEKRRSAAGKGTVPTAPSAPSVRRRWGRYVLVATGVAAAFVVGVLIGQDLPGPIRQVGHAIAPWLVESRELDAARGALDDLGRALAAGDTVAVCDADAEMLVLVGRLSNEEKRQIVPVAHEVHERAVAFVGPDGCG